VGTRYIDLDSWAQMKTFTMSAICRKMNQDRILMDKIKFVHLFKIEEQKIIDLMNNEMVGKQLPLLANGFSAKNCQDFLKAKKRIWDEYGFGPWAFLFHVC